MAGWLDGWLDGGLCSALVSYRLLFAIFIFGLPLRWPHQPPTLPCQYVCVCVLFWIRQLVPFDFMAWTANHIHAKHFSHLVCRPQLTAFRNRLAFASSSSSSLDQPPNHPTTQPVTHSVGTVSASLNTFCANVFGLAFEFRNSTVEYATAWHFCSPHTHVYLLLCVVHAHTHTYIIYIYIERAWEGWLEQSQEKCFQEIVLSRGQPKSTKRVERNGEAKQKQNIKYTYRLKYVISIGKTFQNGDWNVKWYFTNLLFLSSM